MNPPKQNLKSDYIVVIKLSWLLTPSSMKVLLKAKVLSLSVPRALGGAKDPGSAKAGPGLNGYGRVRMN